MRQQYIDILKGFTIIWVLWMHLDLPELIYPSVQMPIFFFISGLFYRVKDGSFLDQIRNDAFRLLLPALFFSLLAFGIGCVRGSVNGDLREIVVYSLSASIVWFLFALFYFRTISCFFAKKGMKIGVLIIALLIYVPGFYLYSKEIYWILPFVPLSHMGVFMIWYAIGQLWGKNIISCIHTPRLRTTGTYVLLTIIYIIVVHCLDWDSGILAKVPWLAYGFPYTLGVIFIMILLASLIENVNILVPITRTLAYVGRNSIVFYLTHWPLWMYVFKPSGWNVYLCFAFIVIIEFPLIYIFNHYLPLCVGRKYK